MLLCAQNYIYLHDNTNVYNTTSTNINTFLVFSLYDYFLWNDNKRENFFYA